MHFQSLCQLLLPYARMKHISSRVECEIRAGRLICAVLFLQSARLLFGDPRYLRLVGVKRGQSLFRCALARRSVEERNQLPNLTYRDMRAQPAVRAHALGKVEPQLS